MHTFKKLFAATMLLVVFAGLNSCKKKYEAPADPTDPNIVANKTIKALKAMHTVSGAYDVITDDIIISGVVVANDKSGNFYKTLFIQDASGALQLSLDATSLYGTYPVGRRVFVYCKGLCLTDYRGTIFLGMKANISGVPSVEGIPANAISNYVVGGSLNNPVVPKVVTASQLTTNMQDENIGALIQLNDYEFQASDTSLTYADTSYYKNSTNLYINGCSSPTQLIVRSSGYANFAALKPAKGNGSIISIYTIYSTDRQLVIRDTSDVKFYGPRCSLFEESFSSLTTPDNNQTFSFAGWKNIGEVGGVTFKNTVFGSTGRAVKASAFSSGQNVVTSWLITPAITLPAATSPKLSFNTAFQFANLATLNAYISTNYNGSNTPSTSTWTLLNANVPANTANNNSSTFSSTTSSGSIDLSSYAGQTVYIGFKYEGADPSAGTKKTTTIQLDDVKIARQ